MLMTESDTIRVLNSDGGLTSLTLARELPVTILMSGLARGVTGVADIVRSGRHRGSRYPV